MAEKAIKQTDLFAWEGTDKKGIKVKGETRGNNPTLIKADLRRQGIKPLNVKKRALFSRPPRKRSPPRTLPYFSVSLPP